MFEQHQFPSAKMIPVNDVILEVFEAGEKNYGNPIVLCHGWPEVAYAWRHQIQPLVEAGYHVIVPNQRGFGQSSCPTDVEAYDIEHLTGDLTALLAHYGYKDAIFVGHDWGAMVVWGLALLHPSSVSKIINLSLPYQERGDRPWIDVMEQFLGEEYYFVHFNKQPGVADAILESNTEQFFNNLYRTVSQDSAPEPGMMMINLAKSEQPKGLPIMSDSERKVYVTSFESSGFTASINWYRNLNRNWHLLANVDPIVHHPTLMIYGEKDVIPRSDSLPSFVPNVDIVSIDCGHWIQQEKPDDTNRCILEWLKK
ncbi:alpha/beta fold hydrolase [Vibrio ulleungensis]|uniref:Alpha/beta hydrolase n=1 Tax=Vibrio ulleungensis TaxID=2807619 RepID=A0ABS2HGR7_9VIBR|nr:alpha/beta hydrolase [Vibrio ulleungensis]MBM7035264.1 alpha/beta hydrolase [Vibrio ulleungensis]